MLQEKKLSSSEHFCHQRCSAAFQLSFDSVHVDACDAVRQSSVLGVQLLCIWKTTCCLVSYRFCSIRAWKPSYSILSLHHLLFSPLLPPSFLSDVCFKVRHRSGCLFPAFLLAPLPLSITFICHSGSDGLSTLCPDEYCTCTVMHMQGYLRRKGCASTLAHALTFSIYCILAMRTHAEWVGQGRRGWQKNCTHNKNVFTSAAVLIPALK